MAVVTDGAHYHKVLPAQGNALDARGHAAHGTHIVAGKAYGKAVCRCQNDMAVVTDGAHYHKLVILTQAHGHEAGFAALGIE